MTAPSKQSCITSGLLDLPDAIIESIIGAARADKLAFMAACIKACRLMMRSTEMTLKITEHTKLAGIKKVLDSFPVHNHLEIICPAEQAIQPNHDSPVSALAVFTGIVPTDNMAEFTPTSRWEGITKVTIQGSSLRCLVPQFIALTCPNLKQLKIVNRSKDPFTIHPAEALPLSLCGNLTQLHLQCDQASGIGGYQLPYYFEPTAIDLPPARHTVAELRQNLPNIDTLVLRHPNTFLIEAFAEQLTRLEIKYITSAVIEPIRQCSHLEQLNLERVAAPFADHVATLILPDNAARLRSLDITYRYSSDDDIRTLLELPSLSVVRLGGFRNIQQDWSGHVCTWQELCIKGIDEDMAFTTLTNLGMSSLKKLSVSPDMVVTLPDPADPNSIAAVQQAVDKLSHIGKITLEDRYLNANVAFGNSGIIAWYGRRGTLEWDLDNNEEAAAELITIAAQRIDPFKICDLYTIIDNPLCLRAVFDWGMNFLESVVVGHNRELAPAVWQAFQQLQRLNTVVFWGDKYDFEELIVENISRAASDAAQHYVIPANRSLRMEFGRMSGFDDDDEPLTADDYAPMRAAILEGMPAGSRLASVKYHSENECRHHRGYGPETYSDAVWVVVIEPSSTA